MYLAIRRAEERKAQTKLDAMEHAKAEILAELEDLKDTQKSAWNRGRGRGKGIMCNKYKKVMQGHENN